MAKPDACKGCVLAEKGEGYAPGEGPHDADYILVGEALGETEAAQARPFVGGSGRILNALLAGAKIWRNRCYITNVIKCRPPHNNLAPYLPAAALHCKAAYLDKELAARADTPVLLLGETALRFVLGLRSITKHRGCVYKRGERWYIPTIHPAALMRDPKMWLVVEDDIRYLGKLDTHEEEDREFIIAPTKQQVLEYLDDARKCTCFIDIETYGQALACVGIATSSRSALCIPYWDGGLWYWDNADEVLEVTQNLSELLNDPETYKVFHNGIFDVTILEEFGFTVQGWKRDTMLMHHLVYSELKHSLAFLHSVYVREPYYKDMHHADKDEVEDAP